MKHDVTEAAEPEQPAHKTVYYAQIPIELLSDKSVSPGAKCQYAAYHSFSKQKNLSKPCQTFVSQSTLAKFLEISVRQAKRNQIELDKEGWILVKKRGGTATNIITLYAKKQVPNQNDEN